MNGAASGLDRDDAMRAVVAPTAGSRRHQQFGAIASLPGHDGLVATGHGGDHRGERPSWSQAGWRDLSISIVQGSVGLVGIRPEPSSQSGGRAFDPRAVHQLTKTRFSRGGTGGAEMPPYGATAKSSAKRFLSWHAASEPTSEPHLRRFRKSGLCRHRTDT